MLGGMLMDISLSVVALLVNLVGDSITGSLSSCANGGVAVLSNTLVCLLGCGSTSTLDGFRNVVGGVPA